MCSNVVNHAIDAAMYAYLIPQVYDTTVGLIAIGIVAFFAYRIGVVIKDHI